MSIVDAAAHLQVSAQTVRRRLHAGLINGEKRETPQGFAWVVEIPESPLQREENKGASDLIGLLRNQLQEKDTQISELHRLLARTALPPAPARRPGGSSGNKKPRAARSPTRAHQSKNLSPIHRDHGVRLHEMIAMTQRQRALLQHPVKDQDSTNLHITNGNCLSAGFQQSG